MEYGVINGIDKKVSRFVHGTIMLSEEKKQEGYQLLDDMYSLGINTFDTAAVYPNNGEGVLLSWINERGIHDDVVVISKCSHPNAYRNRVTTYDIRYDLENSLAKPGADYIDIYMLHRDDRSVPVGPVLEVLNEAKSQGKIKTFGASNWEFDRIEQANEYAYKYNIDSFSSISPHFSLGEQVKNPWQGDCVTLTGEKNKEAREFYQKNRLPVFTYSTLCRGFFSGRFHSNERQVAETVLDEFAKLGYMYDCNFERLRRAEILAEQYQTTVPCITIAWVLAQPMNMFTLIGAENKEIMKDNMRAFDIKMTEQQLKWLNLETNTQ